MRLAIYAHYGSSSEVAGHVFYYLEKLHAMGFRVCFVSNSAVSPASETELKRLCERVMVRENTGFDFCMWQRGIAEYDLAQVEELLLTNSSVIGPLSPLAAIWERPETADCDFWGLTDNEDFNKLHLSSYFLVFRRRALQSERFVQFWRSVLPYTDKWNVIFSYELGLSEWMREGGFAWRAVFPQDRIRDRRRLKRGFMGMCRDHMTFTRELVRNRDWPTQNTTLIHPDILLESGMPFLKASLLSQNTRRMTPPAAFALLEKHGLPKEILQELRGMHLKEDTESKTT